MNANVDSPRSFRPGAVIGGLILLALGAALLLDTTGTFHMQSGHLIAPLVLIVMGAAMTFEGSAFVCTIPERDEDGGRRLRVRRHRVSTGGLWLIWIGVWMIVSQNHLWGLTFATSWPLFLIGMGLMMVIRGWR
jgi:hypothetical protein